MSSGPSDEDPKLLKARIYRRVKALGLSVTQVLVRAGISKSQLYDVMNGKKQPTWGWLKKLAAALQWDVNELTSEKVPKLPVPPRIPAGRKVPLLSLRMAAAVLESERGEAAGYVAVPPPRPVTDDMFAAVVVGRSMEKRIGNGAICLFRLLEGRNPDGKVVLLQLRDRRDPETGGQYTVKRFRVVEREGRRMTQVRLEPTNRKFEAMELDAPERQLWVIAEFLEVLVPAPE
ncbi:MAG TPA: XRE family transcriptional regulator [Myxococcaceae bacterium]